MTDTVVMDPLGEEFDLIDVEVLDVDETQDFEPPTPPEEPDGGGDGPEEPQSANIIVPREIIDIIRAAPSGEKILSACIDLAVFLSQKNISYGDSALDPIRAFSKADPAEQILIRIDDKISRILRGSEYEQEDDLRDLLGYLLLYFVAKTPDQE